jgi:hypothetical protein
MVPLRHYHNVLLDVDAIEKIYGNFCFMAGISIRECDSVAQSTQELFFMQVFYTIN